MTVAARVRRMNLARLRRTTVKSAQLTQPQIYRQLDRNRVSVSPAGLVSSGEPLDGDGCAPLTQVLLARQPAADRFLDANAGGAQLVRSQLLQIGDLASPEEDLRLTKLVFVLILRDTGGRQKLTEKQKLAQKH